ncbi:MAG: hypothetical protein ABEJ46_05385 [Gemmatimonadota bacterium]
MSEGADGALDAEAEGPERRPEEDLAMIRRLMSEGRETAGAGGPFWVLSC